MQTVCFQFEIKKWTKRRGKNAIFEIKFFINLDCIIINLIIQVIGEKQEIALNSLIKLKLALKKHPFFFLLFSPQISYQSQFIFFPHFFDDDVKVLTEKIN